ncbi:MAG TPA: IS21 family transposase [Streptosporangiaceae bacterium]|nr:IS21 family transposase [Streptosporangiaceae bacterium]
MAFREVGVHEIREVLRLWLRGEGIRSVARQAAVDRKTVRRYVEAACECGLDQAAGEGQLCVELLSRVAGRVRPHRGDGHGASWALVAAHHGRLEELLGQGLTVVRAGELLAREGVVVPERTLRRYALEVLGHGRASRTTVRVADCEPGAECQADFGRMGLLDDPQAGRRRVTHALVFTAVYSRHCYVYLTFRQDLGAVIAGCEAAWLFFGGVFKVLIPDNMAAIVDRAHPAEPRLNRAFAEYARDRGFVVDPARVRRPADKPRVERAVAFVRGSFFAGEAFPGGLPQAQRAAEAWCAGRGGQRVHRTTRRRPAEVFAAEEAPRLLPAPVFGYEVPVYATAKVHRDHHIEVAKALYSVPGDLIGRHVDVRAGSKLVRVWHRGQLVKTRPRARPGGRVTDPADLPAHKTAYAMRDIGYLQRLADETGPAIGAYAAALLDHPLPRTKMRQVCALLGLARKWGPARVSAACARALDAEAVSVALIGRMLGRGTENQPVPHTPPLPMPGLPAPGFARDPSHFAVTPPGQAGPR